VLRSTDRSVCATPRPAMNSGFGFGLDGFPLGFGGFDFGVGDEEVPDQSLEGFGVGGDIGGVYGGDDDAGVGDLGGEAAVAADYAADGGAGFLGVFESADEIGADIFYGVAAADGENEDHVGFVEMRAAKPVGVAGVPAFVVNAGGELGNIVGGSVGFDLGDFAEVADSVRCVAGAAANTQKEKTAGAFAQVGEELGGLFDGRLVELTEDVDGFLEIVGGERHLGVDPL
jgi:hypothetical protein